MKSQVAPLSSSAAPAWEESAPLTRGSYKSRERLPLLLLVVALAATTAGMYTRAPLYALTIQLLVFVGATMWVVFRERDAPLAPRGLTAIGFRLPASILALASLLATALSVQRDVSLAMWTQWGSYLLAFLLAMTLLGRPDRLRFAALLFLALGVGAAVVGLWDFLGLTGHPVPVS